MGFLVLASGGHSQAEVSGFLSAVASVAVVRRLSCSADCGIFLEQGLNLCPLHWTTRAVLGGISEGLELQLSQVLQTAHRDVHYAISHTPFFL